MRIVFHSIIFLALLFGGFYIFWPTHTKSKIADLSDFLSNVATEKELQITGINLIGRTEVLSLLPMRKSSAWWKLNQRQIENELLKHPLVQSAGISSCSDLSLSCFNLEIVERSPFFLLAMDQEYWLLGEDGGFIAPVPQERFRRGLPKLPNGRQAILLLGMQQYEASPEAIKSRIGYLRKSLSIIEEILLKPIELVELKDSGEIVVKYTDLNLKATFSKLDMGSDEYSKLRDEAYRLKALLDSYGAGASRIESVDLAFNKVAVIRQAE